MRKMLYWFHCWHIGRKKVPVMWLPEGRPQEILFQRRSRNYYFRGVWKGFEQRNCRCGRIPVIGI